MRQKKRIDFGQKIKKIEDMGLILKNILKKKRKY